MPEKKASSENHTKDSQEEFFIEKQFQIDNTTIIAISGILIALMIIAQYYSPAPIWAIFLIILLLLIFIFKLLIFKTLIETNKISLDDVKNTLNNLLGKSSKKKKPRLVDYPKPKKIDESKYTDDLYSDYILTEDGWKSVEETCAICKRPYADFKHKCGAIFHNKCLKQYFDSLSEENDMSELCPHCHEPLKEEKQPQKIIKKSNEELPEEEIEIDKKPLNVKENEAEMTRKEIEKNNEKYDFKDFEINDSDNEDEKFEFGDFEIREEDFFKKELDSTDANNDKKTIKEREKSKKKEKNEDKKETKNSSSNVVQNKKKDDFWETFKSQSNFIKTQSSLLDKIDPKTLEIKKSEKIKDDEEFGKFEEKEDNFEIDWNDDKKTEFNKQDSSNFYEEESILDKLGIDWLDDKLNKGKEKKI